jgi:hypothetical protein
MKACNMGKEYPKAIHEAIAIFLRRLTTIKLLVISLLNLQFSYSIPYLRRNSLVGAFAAFLQTKSWMKTTNPARTIKKIKAMTAPTAVIVVLKVIYIVS